MGFRAFIPYARRSLYETSGTHIRRIAAGRGVRRSRLRRGFSRGAKTGYFVWQPYFKDMKGSGVEELETGSGVLYGPTLGVILTDDISFSAVALYGTQSTYWDNENTVKPFGPQTIISTGNFYGEIDRVDLDSRSVTGYRRASRCSWDINTSIRKRPCADRF